MNADFIDREFGNWNWSRDCMLASLNYLAERVDEASLENCLARILSSVRETVGII